VTIVLAQSEPKSLPGDFAIWLFIFMELLVFGIFFIIYAVMRLQNTEMFNHYQMTLNREIGFANTLLLIVSSYFVIRAVHAIKLNKVRNSINCLYAALGAGAGFLILKTWEYAEKFAEGISLTTNSFYMFYLSLTIFHLLHVVLGMVILFAVAIKAQRGCYNAKNYIGVETGASYWHMVDLVWIVLFPLVYIIR